MNAQKGSVRIASSARQEDARSAGQTSSLEKGNASNVCLCLAAQMSLRVLTDVAIAMTAITSMAASVYRAARQSQAA